MKESGLQFSDPILTLLEFEVNNDFEVIDNNNNIKMDSSFEITVNKHPDGLKALVKLLQKINHESGESLNSPFKLSIEMMAEFSWGDEIDKDKELVRQLLEKNAPSLILSYLRPIVASITGNSPFPAYNIPFMDFND